MTRRLQKTFVVPNTANKHGYATTIKVIPVYEGWSVEVNGLFESYERRFFKNKSIAMKHARQLYKRLKNKYSGN